MKKLLTWILFINALTISAQEIHVSFQPKVVGTKIDSIWVTNQSTLEKVKLHGADTLVLTKATSNKTIPAYSSEGHLYPNPCLGKASITFQSLISQEVEVRIYNISGQLMGIRKQNLSPGNHRFQMSFPDIGLFTVSVLKLNGSFTQKAINMGTQRQKCSIEYSGTADQITLKSVSSKNDINYTEGDILMFSIFSDRNNTIIMDSPDESKVLTVEFYECFDADGNSYAIVKIGDQIWMAENLKTTHYNEGSEIPYATDDATWSVAAPAFCWYDNNIGNIIPYGALYNWYAVITGKLCPSGWHVPNDTEWIVLENYLIANGYNFDGSSVENKISKSIAAYSNWVTSTIAGSPGYNPSHNNLSGFTALPSGVRSSSTGFSRFGESSYWWTSSESPLANGWMRGISYQATKLSKTSFHKTYGLNIRCVKGENIETTTPTVTTNSIPNISQTTATIGGNVTSDGGATVTAKGVCWNTSGSPTILNSKTTDGTGPGTFTSNLTGLTANTTYYVKAYATNINGTSYGSQVSFTTSKVYTTATVSTTEAKTITPNSAELGGNVTSDGNTPVTERGVCFSISQNPTTTNNKTALGSGSGIFSTTVNGLTANTTYYVRAYAINNQGTSYGSQISFTTSTAISLPCVTTYPIHTVTQTTSKSGGSISSDGGATITAKGLCWDIIPNPDVTSSKTSNGTGTADFSGNLNGLTANTTYYVRAYASNSLGTGYGDEIIFTTCKDNVDCSGISSCNILLYSHAAINQLNLTNSEYKKVHDVLFKVDKNNAYHVFTRDPNDFMFWCSGVNPSSVNAWSSLQGARHETNHQINAKLRSCNPSSTSKYLFFGNVYYTELKSGQTSNYSIVDETIPDILKTHVRYDPYILNSKNVNGNDFRILLDEFNSYTGDVWFIVKYWQSDLMPAMSGTLTTNGGIDGMLNFMVWFGYYIKSARINYPTTYSLIKSQSGTLKYIQKLWSTAEEMLSVGYPFTVNSGSSSKFKMSLSMDYFNAAYSNEVLSELDQLGITHKPKSFWQGTYVK